MQTYPDWYLLDAALDRALDLEGEARTEYLTTLDPDLRRAVEPLLAEALRDNPILDHRDAALQTLLQAQEPPAREQATATEGTQIGPYRIEALVGEGGMGRVYRAHRNDGTFQQTVALKIVRQSLALAGSDVAQRLRRERDLLATLDHDGIACLLDGGETDDGVPYLVTEFIDGAPITTWADARALDVADRIRLVIEVARAVDHAHRRFVVHRDLKPSNVLVTERDGVPRPVVLDFGIAKLLEQAEELGTFGFPLTRTGVRMLTPAYAAPELFTPDPVTTAVDVYGLGALLYELLTDRRPHEDNATPGLGTREVTRPSEVVTQAVDGEASFDPLARSRVLRGDLDVICLKALHPEARRRYDSAAELADDLERHLEGLPVEARPDSVGYVLGRFVRRHRFSVGAGVVAVLALIVGLGFSLVTLAGEREARAEAEAAAARAKEASEILVNVFESANPLKTEGRMITVREALGDAVDRVQRVEDDILRGYLLTQLGILFRRSDERVRADSLFAQALAAYEASEAPPIDEMALARERYAGSRVDFQDYEVGLALFQQAHREATSIDPPSDPVVFAALSSYPWIYRSLGRIDEAIHHSQQLLSYAQASGDPHKTMSGHYELSFSLLMAGRYEEALTYAEQSLAAVKRIDATPYRIAYYTTFTHCYIGTVLQNLERFDEAVRYHERCVEAFQEIDVQQTKHTIHAKKELGEIALLRRQYVVAKDTFAALHRLAQDPSFHFEKPAALLGLAFALNGLEDFTAAESAARSALAQATVLYGETSPLSAWATAQLGLALVGRGQHEAARPYLETARSQLRLLTREKIWDQVEWALHEREVAWVEKALDAIGRSDS